MFVAFTFILAATQGGEPNVAFRAKTDGKLHIEIAGKPFATYVFRDPKLPRPYLADVLAPNGLQVSRNHPPLPGKDLADHADFHPGLWLAFGDLGGGDFWRNKGAVDNAGLVLGKDGFTATNRYRAGDKTICTERCMYTIVVRPHGTLLLWDAEFRGEAEFAFGDQEEMGLGLRVATPLAVKNGGRIVNREGKVNERQVWGQPSDWCAYSGASDGKEGGVLLLADPDNFRKSWFHARDYGLLVANPFGRHAFTRADKSRVVVAPGEALRLRYGVLVYAGQIDLEAAYRDYLAQRGRAQPAR